MQCFILTHSCPEKGNFFEMSQMNKFLISHLMLVTPLDWILSVDCEDLFEARLRLGDDDDEDDEDCVGKQLSFNG